MTLCLTKVWFVFFYDSESQDLEMLREDNLLKVLHWASQEGRIHLMDQFIETSMGFLWTSQQSKICTSLPRHTAG